MNFSVIFKYLGILLPVVGAIEGIAASIQAGMSASTPPINTYLDGVHGSLTLVWTPLGQPVNSGPSAGAIADAHVAATSPAESESDKPETTPTTAAPVL